MGPPAATEQGGAVAREKPREMNAATLGRHLAMSVPSVFPPSRPGERNPVCPAEARSCLPPPREAGARRLRRVHARAHVQAPAAGLQAQVHSPRGCRARGQRRSLSLSSCCLRGAPGPSPSPAGPGLQRRRGALQPRSSSRSRLAAAD